jgi:glycosyltransferase involved in cell wall biosynthesis
MTALDRPVHAGSPAGGGRRKSVLFFAAVDWYFCLHWLALARAVQAAGYDVAVMTEVTDQGPRMRAAGLRVLPIRLSRKGMNPVAELRALAGVRRLLRDERPDLLHNIAQKPVLYGSLGARAAGVGAVVNTLAGMGYLFTSPGLRARAVRALVVRAYRRLLRGPRVRVVVQNPDDREQLAGEAGLDAVLIPGAGVDLDRFGPAPEPAGTPAVVLASRLLWDKGVGEFVEAARLLRARGVPARFVLVGRPDAQNPSAVPEARLEEWHRRGEIEWWGYRSDMPAVLAQAHVVCLPSYREGLPTILIEAAAAGRPLVASDVPGCREVVRPGVNGSLVPARDAAALAAAIEPLVRDKALRDRYGGRSRSIAEAEFGIGRIAADTLALYRELLT